MRDREDPLVRSGRRETVVVFLIWAAAFAYTIGYSYAFGYNRSLDGLTFVLGFPDWVFWGIVVPWSSCVVVSFLFGARFMRDEQLADETPVLLDASEQRPDHE